MASITLENSHKNLIFASLVAEQAGATFEEEGRHVIISDSPELTIPSYCFIDALDPSGHRQQSGADFTRMWRSLLLNKTGYLKHFSDHEIVLSDAKPKDNRPTFLLRFPSDKAKALAESLAERLGYSLTEYINNAIESHNESWEAAQDG